VLIVWNRRNIGNLRVKLEIHAQAMEESIYGYEDKFVLVVTRNIQAAQDT
jgi:hypothetical protein